MIDRLVVGADVARPVGEHDLVVVGWDHRVVEHVPTGLIDRKDQVCVDLRPATPVTRGSVGIESGMALLTARRRHEILGVAEWAMVLDFVGGHRDEDTRVPFDDPQILDSHASVEHYLGVGPQRVTCVAGGP